MCFNANAWNLSKQSTIFCALFCRFKSKDYDALKKKAENKKRLTKGLSLESTTVSFSSSASAHNAVNDTSNNEEGRVTMK